MQPEALASRQLSRASCCHLPRVASCSFQRRTTALQHQSKQLSSRTLTTQLPVSQKSGQQFRVHRCSCASEGLAKPGRSRRGLIQHKEEAFWFYRFLSIVYDKVVNPGHWTIDMRTDALEPAKLDSPDLKVIKIWHASS